MSEIPTSEVKNPLTVPTLPPKALTNHLQHDAHGNEKSTSIFSKGFAVSVNSVLSLGVVFGDIGTSPLYVYSSVFTHKPTENDILGTQCLIFYTFLLIAIFKYAVIVMNYDHKGEGGVFAMSSLLPAFKENIWGKIKKWTMVVMAIVAASFVVSDGIITPAISVLSALEGLELVSPEFHSAIIVLACLILVGIFMIQSMGTGKLGFIFGPIVLLWMLILGSIGIYNCATHSTAIWKFFNPYYGYLFFAENGVDSLHMLGGIVLCITGVEAMYADIGHFGKASVRISLMVVVLPCVMITYIGQGAYLLNRPEDYSSAFYSSLPPYTPVFWGVLIVATFATIIASQAMITGTFSLLTQAMTLNYFPRLKVKQTSKHHRGQIYVPVLNYSLLIACLIIVVSFQSSTSLASAYGIAVVTVLCIDSLLLTWVNYENSWFLPKSGIKWYNNWIFRFAMFAPILVFCLPFEMTYLAANYIKIPTGGWLSLLIGFCIAGMMLLWTIGVSLINQWDVSKMTFAQFYTSIQGGSMLKLNGTGVLLNQKKYEEIGEDDDDMPQYVVLMTRKLNAVHENQIFINYKFYPTPQIDEDSRYSVTSHGDGFHVVSIRYGFYEKPPRIEKTIKRLSQTVMKNDPILKTDLHYYQQKRHISVNQESWFFIRYPVILFCLLFNNTRNGDNVQITIPSGNLFEFGVKVTMPPQKKDTSRNSIELQPIPIPEEKIESVNRVEGNQDVKNVGSEHAVELEGVDSLEKKDLAE